MNEFAPIRQQVDPFAASLAGRRLGRYEVLARLATGGMAAVYIARAIGVAGFERLFAVKVLHPHLAHEKEFVTMFLDEARLVARIRHPNVVAIIDISDTPDAGYYLVMDYVEGDHLGALVREASKTDRHRLPTDAALRIVVEALGGLGAAHELTDGQGRSLNVVHRDISPQNIMVGTDGIARLTDFGVAKAEERDSTTREGQFKGKLAYMSPEHASEGYTDQRSDLFAMATILWECLTGHRLFRAENHAATLNKVCLEPIPRPSSVLPELAPFDDILDKGLARNPDERFQSATDFVDAIEERAGDVGGIGNKRTIATLVKTLAVEKIDSDRELIRKGIEAVTIRTLAATSSSAERPAAVARARPPPVESQAAAAVFAPQQPGGPPPLPRTDISSRQAQPSAAERGTTIWLAGGIVLILVLGASVVALLIGDDETGSITTSPLQPTEDVAPAQPVPDPAEETKPEPTEAAKAPGDEEPAETDEAAARKDDKRQKAAKALVKRAERKARKIEVERETEQATKRADSSEVSRKVEVERETEQATKRAESVVEVERETEQTKKRVAPERKPPPADILDNPYR